LRKKGHNEINERLKDAWLHEDMRSLEWDDPLNAPYVVVLKGLDTFEAARMLADRCLNHESFVLSRSGVGISPFTDSSLLKVWEATKPKPRDFLRVLNTLLQIGSTDRVDVLDEAFIEPKLKRVLAEARNVPLPIIFEAVARDVVRNLSVPDEEAIRYRVPWAFRTLQAAVAELAQRVADQSLGGSPVPAGSGSRPARKRIARHSRATGCGSARQPR